MAPAFRLRPRRTRGSSQHLGPVQLKTGVARSQGHKPIRSLGMQIGVQPGPLWGPQSLRLGPGRAIGCLCGAAWCRPVPVGAKELARGGEHRPITLSPGARGAGKAALVAQTCVSQGPVEGMQGGEMGGWGADGCPPGLGVRPAPGPRLRHMPLLAVRPPTVPQSLSSRTSEGGEGRGTFTDLASTPVTVCHVSGYVADAVPGG